MSDKPVGEFEHLADEQPEYGLIGEFWYFLKSNKKWWLLPILVLLLLIGAMLLLSTTAIAPFIYTLF